MAPSGKLLAPNVPVFAGDAGSEPAAATATLQQLGAWVERRRPLVAPFELKNTPVDAPSPSESGLDETSPFYPDQLISSLTAVFVVLSLIAVLTIFLPVGLQAKADPNLTPAHVKPDWYFLFLYEFLHFAPTIVGLFAPLVAIVALIALPFLDRNPERAPTKRVLAIGACLLVVAAVVAISIVGYLE